jgi:hypothetical protein
MEQVFDFFPQQHAVGYHFTKFMKKCGIATDRIVAFVIQSVREGEVTFIN